MRTRWASCTPGDCTIRCERLRDVPGWVLDYVLVHELAHLLEPGHDERFWKWVRRYPERNGRSATWRACRQPPGSSSGVDGEDV